MAAVLGACAALTLGGAAAAAPTDPTDRVDVIVKTSDVDLRTPDGAKLMALRIRNAAAEACGRQAFPVTVLFSDGFIRCREDAIDRAVATLNAPLVADALGRAPQVFSRNE